MSLVCYKNFLGVLKMVTNNIFFSNMIFRSTFIKAWLILIENYMHCQWMKIGKSPDYNCFDNNEDLLETIANDTKRNRMWSEPPSIHNLTPLSTPHPSPPRTSLYLFLNFRLLTTFFWPYHPNEIRHKNKNKLRGKIFLYI